MARRPRAGSFAAAVLAVLLLLASQDGLLRGVRGQEVAQDTIGGGDATNGAGAGAGAGAEAGQGDVGSGTAGDTSGADPAPPEPGPTDVQPNATTPDPTGPSQITVLTDSIDSSLTLYNCSLLAGLQGCSSTTSTDIYTSAVINGVLGAACFLGFGVLRGHVKVYRARLASPATTVKPPRLPEGGLCQIFSWILPVLGMSDQSLLASAGLDALMFSRFLMMCVQFFIPVTLFSVGILLPIHYTSTGSYNRCGFETVPENQDTLQRMSISNVCNGDPLLWVHFVFIYLSLAWAMWLLQKHYVAFASLRHHYIGLPQKPNYWFEKFILQPNGDNNGGGKSLQAGSPVPEESFFSPLVGVVSEESALSSPMSRAGSPLPLEGDGESQQNKSISDIVFNVTSWRDIARSWMMPDKLLDNKGEEPEDLKMFSSQMPSQTVRLEGNSNMSTYVVSTLSLTLSPSLLLSFGE